MPNKRYKFKEWQYAERDYPNSGYKKGDVMGARVQGPKTNFYFLRAGQSDTYHLASTDNGLGFNKKMAGSSKWKIKKTGELERMW